MLRNLLLLAVLLTSLHAKEIESRKPRFKISFPDGAGWSAVVHQAQGTELNVWSAENKTEALVLNLQVIDAPMPEAKPTFKENAEEWEKGMMPNFSRKISARFAKLGDQEAYELVTSIKNGDHETFFSNWMLQIGDVTYGITIISGDQSKLSGNIASAFLKSLSIAK